METENCRAKEFFSHGLNTDETRIFSTRISRIDANSIHAAKSNLKIPKGFNQSARRWPMESAYAGW